MWGFEVGDPVRIEMEKWGQRPHWHVPGCWLGSDDDGDWIGVPAGTRLVRPGAEVTMAYDHVVLVPAPAADLERAFLATFHPPLAETWIYVDMTTPPVWDSSILRAIDLDLDVIRMQNGWVLVDDEDEFAEHQIELGYPPGIIAMAEATRDRVHDAILEEHAPYDGRHEVWLERLGELAR